MKKLWRGERQAGGGPSGGGGGFTESFVTRVESARRSLWFTATFQYNAGLAAYQAVPPLHPDAVARSLLRDLTQEVAVKFQPLEIDAAQDEVNRTLSQPVETDPRLLITARVTLTLPTETEALARRLEAAEQQAWAAEHRELARLEVLRERMLDPGLGLAWWIDTYADLQFATGDPEEKAKAVIRAFDIIHKALRENRLEQLAEEHSLIRGRVDELLTALSDPETAGRAAALLEQAVEIIHRRPRPKEPRLAPPSL